MSTSRTAVGLIVSAGLLVGGGVAAGTLAATGALASSTPTPTPSASGTPGAPGDPDGDGRNDRHGDGPGRFRGGLGLGPGPGMRDGVEHGRMLHGEIVVETSGGGTETLLVQHGSVTAKASDSVTVRSSDGFTVTWQVTSDTKILVGPRRSDGTTSTLADVATGVDVVVTGPKTADGGTARAVGVRPTGSEDGRGPGTRQRGGTPTPSATTSPATLNG